MRVEQGVDLREWPVWTPEDPAATRRGRLRTVIAAAVFLVFLVRSVVQEWGLPVGSRVALVAVACVYVASYLLTLYLAPLHGRLVRSLSIGWLYLAGAAFALVTADPSDLALLSYAVAAGIILLPLRWGVLLGVLTTLSVMAGTWLVDGAVDWRDTFVLLMMTAGLVTVTQLIRTVNQLRTAHDRIRVLAVADERSRLARDMHDVLGHSLTTITVKTGLARRILESGADPARALTELRDAERLSRQALGEIRATVSGYRRPSLAAELAGVHEALRAADITAVLPQAVDDVAEELREPFSYVLREGITNVIRHSGANRCEVRLGPRCLEIRDDGRPTNGVAAGTGLTGLTERMAAVGGRLTAEPLPGKGFRLCAEA
ncbi:sensor histidine kinase [Pseudonocardia sp. DSM 110487]|uniref:sensor histidine kinase n=1 Tax=Pseudonocardia sp. DSM 110487 TaxID=2865833 RepID=UPI001C6A58D9|nr:histidine kinase [Pseudonocardia sp. DSM 110487]QYN37224.1 sensor histidine kinase [Pseudonocardia sp. DSM 110487]